MILAEHVTSNLPRAPESSMARARKPQHPSFNQAQKHENVKVGGSQMDKNIENVVNMRFHCPIQPSKMTRITSKFFNFEAGHLITFAFVIINIQKPLFIFRSKTLSSVIVYAADFSSAWNLGCFQYPTESVRWFEGLELQDEGGRSGLKIDRFYKNANHKWTPPQAERSFSTTSSPASTMSPLPAMMHLF